MMPVPKRIRNKLHAGLYLNGDRSVTLDDIEDAPTIQEVYKALEDALDLLCLLEENIDPVILRELVSKSELDKTMRYAYAVSAKLMLAIEEIKK